MAEIVIFVAGFTTGVICTCRFFGWYYRRYGFDRYRSAWEHDISDDKN